MPQPASSIYDFHSLSIAGQPAAFSTQRGKVEVDRLLAIARIDKH